MLSKEQGSLEISSREIFNFETGYLVVPKKYGPEEKFLHVVDPFGVDNDLM